MYQAIGLDELWCKKAVYRRWKQGQAVNEKFKNTAQACKGGVRKAKAQLQLRLARMSRATSRASTVTLVIDG